MEMQGMIRDRKEALALLASMPIMQGVKRDTLGLMSEALDVISLGRAEIVFDRGSLPTGLFFVLEGSVKLIAMGADRRSRVVELFEKGQMFGEIGVFTGQRYRTWTETTGETTLLHVNKAAVNAAVEADHRFTRTLLQSVTARTQRLIDAIGATSPPTADVRIAAYLLDLGGDCDEVEMRLILPAAKCTIASLLNMSKESLSRALRRMMDADLVWVSGRRIRVKDRNRLLALTYAHDDGPAVTRAPTGATPHSTSSPGSFAGRVSSPLC